MATILGPDGLPINTGSMGPVDAPEPTNNIWYTWANSFVEGISNPDAIPLETYDRMCRTDETVASGLRYLVHGVLSSLGEYEHEDPEIQEFVRLNLERMKGNFLDACSQVLRAVQYGFTASEFNLHQVDGQIRLRSIQTMHPKDVTFDLFRSGPQKNEISRVWQFWRSENQAEIPVAKSIIYSYRGNFGNPYGESDFRPAYKNWLIKDVILRCYGTCMERYGIPYTIGKPGTTGDVNVSGTRMSSVEYMGKVLDSMGPTGSLVLPPGSEAEIHYAPAGLGQSMEEALRYLNRSIHQSIGLPSLIADAGSVGSYSLGQVQSGEFSAQKERLREDVIDVFLDQLIRPLVEWNYGPQEDYGDFCVDDFDPARAKAMAELTKILIDSGVVDLNRLDDVNSMRERNNMPPLSEEELLAEFPTLPETDPAAPPLTPPVRPKNFSYSAKRANRLLRRANRQRKALFTAF